MAVQTIQLTCSPLLSSTSHLLSTLSRPYRGEFSALSSPHTIVLEGYLQKKGRVIRSWKTRWIVLTKVDLTYYVDETGTYRFTSDTEIRIEDGRSNRLKFGLLSTTSRTRVFMTSNEESRELWVTTLGHVLTAFRQREMMEGGDGDGGGEEGEEEEDMMNEGEGEKEGEGVEAGESGSNGRRVRRGSGFQRVFGQTKQSQTKAGTKGEFLNENKNIFISTVITTIKPTTDSDNNTTPHVDRVSRRPTLPLPSPSGRRRSHNVSRSAPTVTILLAGWLTKRGHINHSWKVRWFEVTKEVVTTSAFPPPSSTTGRGEGTSLATQAGVVIVEYFINYYHDRTEQSLLIKEAEEAAAEVSLTDSTDQQQTPPEATSSVPVPTTVPAPATGSVPPWEGFN